MTAALLTQRTGSNDHILIMTLSNHGLRNALHPDMYAAGIEVLNTAGQSKAIRAIVLRGADHFFCAGGNLNRLLSNRDTAPVAQREAVEQLGHWVEAIQSCPKPIIASVEGVAAGAGLALALACDMIVAADNARFMSAYVKHGLSPDGGLSWFLPQLLPKAIAFEMMMLGDPIEAKRLYELGVVNKLVAPKQADASAIEIAQRFSQGPQHAQRSIKYLLNNKNTMSLTEHLAIEREQFMNNLLAKDASEGIHAFLEKRMPEYD